MANEFSALPGFFRSLFQRAGLDPNPWLDLSGYSGPLPPGVSTVTAVASQAAMLALPDSVGQRAVRTDLGEVYVQVVSPANVLANWESTTADQASEIPATPLAPFVGANVQAQLDEAATHAGNTSNPHGVTAAQAGADPAGTAAAAVSAHDGAYVHSDIALNTAARHTQGTDQGLDTGGPNAVTAAQAKAAYDHSQLTGGGLVNGDNPHNATLTDILAAGLPGAVLPGGDGMSLLSTLNSLRGSLLCAGDGLTAYTVVADLVDGGTVDFGLDLLAAGLVRAGTDTDGVPGVVLLTGGPQAGTTWLVTAIGGVGNTVATVVSFGAPTPLVAGSYAAIAFVPTSEITPGAAGGNELGVISAAATPRNGAAGVAAVRAIADGAVGARAALVAQQTTKGGVTDAVAVVEQLDNTQAIPAVQLSNAGPRPDIALTVKAAKPATINEGDFGYSRDNGGRLYTKDQGGTVREVAFTSDPGASQGVRTTIANDLSLTDNGKTVLINAAGTYSMPAPTADAKITVKRISGGSGGPNHVILSSVANGGLIDGATTHTLTNKYDARTFESDGVNWWVF